MKKSNRSKNNNLKFKTVNKMPIVQIYNFKTILIFLERIQSHYHIVHNNI